MQNKSSSSKSSDHRKQSKRLLFHFTQSLELLRAKFRNSVRSDKGFDIANFKIAISMENIFLKLLTCLFDFKHVLKLNDN